MCVGSACCWSLRPGPWRIRRIPCPYSGTPCGTRILLPTSDACRSWRASFPLAWGPHRAHASARCSGRLLLGRPLHFLCATCLRCVCFLAPVFCLHLWLLLVFLGPVDVFELHSLLFVWPPLWLRLVSPRDPYSLYLYLHPLPALPLPNGFFSLWYCSLGFTMAVLAGPASLRAPLVGC